MFGLVLKNDRARREVYVCVAEPDGAVHVVLNIREDGTHELSFDPDNSRRARVAACPGTHTHSTTEGLKIGLPKKAQDAVRMFLGRPGYGPQGTLEVGLKRPRGPT